jgi:hypothetical protein
MSQLAMEAKIAALLKKNQQVCSDLYANVRVAQMMCEKCVGHSGVLAAQDMQPKVQPALQDAFTHLAALILEIAEQDQKRGDGIGPLIRSNPEEAARAIIQYNLDMTEYTRQLTELVLKAEAIINESLPALVAAEAIKHDVTKAFAIPQEEREMSE